ncbi:hypothetical protein L7F22_035194 [Adiantum nelumboides]|nr:hypothetical protein [Adiantum nelumboides]
MLPQQGPCYPAALAAGAAPVYGQPGFYTHSNQSLIVPMGIPAGVAPVYGSGAHGANVVPGGTLVHVGNVVPGVAHVHMGNSQMGNLPALSLPASNAFVQPQPSSFIQPSASKIVYETSSNTDLPGQWQGHTRRSCSPPPSSFPPGFEPRHSNNIAMGIPSQPAPDNCGQGGMTMHVQHQRQFQQQHQQQNQLNFQHPQHFHSQQQQLQPGQQLPHSHQHQSQHQQQHQFHNQPPHPHQHQHKHQHQQHNLLQSQHHHHPPQFQCQQDSQQQHQHQQPQAQQRHQYEHQQYQHPHSDPQRFTQIQPQNFHQPNSHHQLQPQMSQPQLHEQSYTTSQQAQPLIQLHQPDFHTCTANAVAIGLPVMPTQSNLDAMIAQSMVHSQQPTPIWQQPAHLEIPSSTLQAAAPIHGSSLKGNVLDNGSLVVVSQGELYSNGYHSTNIHRANELLTKVSSERAESLSLSTPKSHLGPKAMRSADFAKVDNTQINGHVASDTARPSSSIESNHRNWPSSPRVQLQEGTSAGNPSRASRGYQPHSNRQFTSQSNRPLPTYREKFSGNRGKPFSKGLGKRSDMQPSRCEPCDRTFTTSEVLADHLKSHVKCGEEGCLFEAAVCQKVKFYRHKALGLLQPLPIPDKPWESIAIDFIFDLLRTPTINDGIWTIICRFNKQVHFVLVRKKIKSEHMVKLFMHNIFKYHEMPQFIVSDSDPRMTSLFWKALFENMGTTLKLSSSFDSQTDGQLDEANSNVLNLFKCYVSEHKATWEHYLSLVEYTYNNTVHTSTGKAPFEIMDSPTHIAD